MTREDKRKELFIRFRELTKEIFPNDEDMDYLLVLMDTKDNIDLFHCTSCPRCAVVILEESLDANGIKHNNEELDEKVH